MHKLKFDNLHIVYIIGIGGIGMSALARWFNIMGKRVLGYDRTSTSLTSQLIEEGINIHFEDSIDNIPKDIASDKSRVLVVYTPAIPSDHQELLYFSDHGYVIKKRSEVLGIITEQFYTIAVAGTHGKTTTTSIIAHILKSAGKQMVAFVGGISTNYGSNFIINGDIDNDTIAVVEADEFDRSFLSLNPNVSVVTSLDADHLDIYGNKNEMEDSFKEFINRTSSEGRLVINQKVVNNIGEEFLINHKKYSLDKSEIRAENLKIKEGKFEFDYVNGSGSILGLSLQVPGYHNVENVIAAIAVTLGLGVSAEDIKTAISSYSGVRRRFEYIIRSSKIIFIDDYAHHPVEIESFLESVRALYPEKQITVVFQPHLYSRTRDFAAEFSKSLSLADALILMDIYPAREEPIPGVSSEIIFENVKIKNKWLLSGSDMINKVSELDPELLVTIGAGDIDQFVEPLKLKLS